MKELYMLTPEGSKIAMQSLTDCAKKDIVTLNAFHFIYGIGVMFDGITNGEQLYDYLQSKSLDFTIETSNKVIGYLKKLDRESAIFEIGKRLLLTNNEKELGAIFYNNNNKEELVKIFNEELF